MATVATAFVQILPSFAGIEGALTSGLTSAATKSAASAGTAAGGVLGKIMSNKMALAVGGGLLVLGGLAVKGLSDAVEVGKKFDTAMSDVAATMGVSVDEIGNLRDFAKEMGATTAFSATEAAEALNYMALAGYSADESMSMLPTVLNLAAAGSIDLASASDMVTDAQSALGLSMEETTTMVDQMAKASSKTNTSVAQLGDAILKIGGTAKMMNGGTAELTQTLGLLADNGIKGAEGGTHLRNMILSLTNPTDEAKKTLESLGVAVYDADGKMRSMQDIFLDLQGAMAGMTDEEQMLVKSGIFNKTDLSAVNALLGTTAERWDEVGDAIADSAGAAQEMADTKLDNLEGDVTMFQSAWEGLQITISEAVMPALRGFVQFATGAVQRLNEFVTEHKETFDKLGEVLSVVAGVAGGALSVAFELVGQVLVGLATAITTVAEGFGALPAIAEQITTTLYETVNGFVQNIVSGFEFLSQTVTSIWNGIQSTIAGVWNNIKSGVSGAVSAVKNTVSSVFNSIKSTVTSIWNGIKNAITKPIETAKNLVKSAIDTISGIITGANLKLPEIKLPHFNIYGGEIPWGIGGMGKKPEITIDWYARGGIISGPSLIGAGEAGPEAIVPLSQPYIEPWADAVADEIGTDDVIRWLAGNLPAIIANYTPTIGERDFNRLARRAFANGSV